MQTRDRRQFLHNVFALLVSVAASWVTPTATLAQTPVVIIDRPTAGETVHSNTGTVPVAVSIPGRAFGASDRLRVLIDGKPYGPEQRVTSFELQGIERGEHSLLVQIVDAKGRTLASSSSVTFYLWQASILFPGRKTETPPSK